MQVKKITLCNILRYLSAIDESLVSCFSSEHMELEISLVINFELGMFLLDADSSEDDLVVLASTHGKWSLGKSSEAVEELATQLCILIKVGKMRRLLILKDLHLVLFLLHSPILLVFFFLLPEFLLPRLLHVLYFLLSIVHLIFQRLPIKLVVDS